MSTAIVHKTNPPWQWGLWGRWILANALSETVGLGSTLLIGAFLLVQAEPIIGTVPAAVLGVLAATLIEGSLVGTAQWLVLRRPLPRVRWRAWVTATALGACVAWTLGMVPSILLSTGTSSSTQISDLVVYALAAGLGLVAGFILGFPQWFVLRSSVSRAGWWGPANALAWMVGMVVVFIGTGFIPETGITWPIAFLLLVFVLAAGALVGAIHGLVLVWLLRRRL